MFKYILMVFAGAGSYGILSTLVRLTYDEGYNAAQVSFLQALLGAMVLWIMVALQRKPVRRMGMRTLFLLLLTGSAIGLTTWLYYLSVQYIPASIAIIMLMQFTWLTVLFDWLLLNNVPGVRLLIAITLILAGTVLAAGGNGAGVPFSLKGLLIAFASALAYALYIVANSRVGREHAPVTRSAIIVSGAALTILLVNCRTLSEGFPVTLSFGKWIGLLTLFGTIIPPVLFAKGIPKIGVSLSSVLMVAEMPVAIVCACVVLKEQVSGVQWVGMVLMLGAMVYLNINRR